MRSSRALVTLLALAATALACSKEDARRAASAGSAAPAGIATSPPVQRPTIPGMPGKPGEAKPQCAFISAADVEAVIGKPATAKGHTNPDVCAVFTVDDQEVVVVGRADGSFDSMVGAVPSQYFPVRTDVPGLGDAAVQFKGSDPSASPQLYVRKGDATVFFLGSSLPESQVKALAERVLPRL